MSVTCCPLSDYDGDDASFSVVDVLLSRKEHTCCECGLTIPVKSKYQRAKGLWDGLFGEYKTCIPCAEVREHFACNGWIYKMLWKDIEGNLFPNMVAGGECLQGASPTAKAKLFEMYSAWFLEGGYKERQWFHDQEEKADHIKQILTEVSA